MATPALVSPGVPEAVADPEAADPEADDATADEAAADEVGDPADDCAGVDSPRWATRPGVASSVVAGFEPSVGFVCTWPPSSVVEPRFWRHGPPRSPRSTQQVQRPT